MLKGGRKTKRVMKRWLSFKSKLLIDFSGEK